MNIDGVHTLVLEKEKQALVDQNSEVLQSIKATWSKSQEKFLISSYYSKVSL